MKMLPLYAAAAGLTLLGATPPPDLYGPPQGYPPCSAGVTDRCIQLHERGVASPRNLALNERLGQGGGGRRFARMGPMPGPMGRIPDEMREDRGRRVVVASNDYPRCGGGIEDRCIQANAAARSYRHYDREAVRIGERG